MGFGLPAAIGVQMGCPDKTVVDIAGDGSIQMNFQELVVAVEHKLPVNIVILNNGHLGMVRQWQEMFYKDELSGTVLGQSGRGPNEQIADAEEPEYLPDFLKLAEAHGALGLRASTKDEVIPALKAAFESPRPAVVECIVKPAENVFPMVPPGASLKETLHGMA